MKAMDNIRGRPRFRIVGVIVHGVGHWVYVVPPTVRGGASQTCTILHMVLEEALDYLKKEKKPLPAHLWIQADNCGGDNKNHVVLGFCAMLVARGVFKTVQMNHLVVGHTHEDIDAFFAIISRILKGSPPRLGPASGCLHLIIIVATSRATDRNEMLCDGDGDDWHSIEGIRGLGRIRDVSSRRCAKGPEKEAVWEDPHQGVVCRFRLDNLHLWDATRQR